MYRETVKETKQVFAGKIIRVEIAEVDLPDGRPAQREIVRHYGGACILPLDDEGNVYLVRQFRIAFNESTLEAPAGKLEKGEDPMDCALRELSEETGFHSEDIDFLGEFYPTPGYCSEKIYVYLARSLRSGEMHLDDAEFLHCEKLSFAAALQMVERNEIHDAKTVLALLRTKQLLGRE